MTVKEYRRGNQKWTVQRNWQHWVHKTKSSVGHHYAKTNKCNVKQSKFVGKYIISKLHLKFTFPNFNNVPVILRLKILLSRIKDFPLLHSVVELD